MVSIPFIVDSLDDEPKCGAHAVDIFAHNLLDYSCFACIVKSSAREDISIVRVSSVVDSVQHQNPHLLVLQSSFP